MHWILKTEKSCYSFSDLEKDKKTNWDGVRNYQARNNLKSMKKGELALIYHSVNDKQVVGIAKITKEYFPDLTATEGEWVAVELCFDHWLKNPVSLAEIKENPKLQNLSLVRQGRLSVCPTSKAEWDEIIKMSN